MKPLLRASLGLLALLTGACASARVQPSVSSSSSTLTDPFAGLPPYENQTSAMPMYLGHPYRNETCLITFLAPVGWTVFAEPNVKAPRGCQLSLVKNSADTTSFDSPVPDWNAPSISLSVYWQPVLAALAADGFEQVGSRWHTPVSELDVPTRIDLPNGGSGLCYSRTSNPAGGRPHSYLSCVLGTPSISVKVNLNEDHLTIGERLIPTIAFLEPGPV